MGFRRKRRRSRLKSHSTIHKCPQLRAEPQIHFHKWPKLLQLIFTVKRREISTKLPRSPKQFSSKHTITLILADMSSLATCKCRKISKKEPKTIPTQAGTITLEYLIIGHLASAPSLSTHLNSTTQFLNFPRLPLSPPLCTKCSAGNCGAGGQAVIIIRQWGRRQG